MTKAKEVLPGIGTGSYGTLKWLPILMYHHVVPQRHQGLEHLEVTFDEFDQQMKYLREHGYGSVHLDEATRGLAQGQHTVDRPVVITFDDGFLDVFLHAFPILKNYSFTADLFLVSSHLDPTGSGAAALTSRLPLMGVEQIEEMAGYGISFGSHSITHRRLTEINHQEAREEIQGSKIALERLLGLPVDSFSFPYGSSTSAIREMAREAGYLRACGIEQREHELYNLSRIDASRCRGADLRWQMRTSGLYFNLRQRNSLRKLKDFLIRRKPHMAPDGCGPDGYAVDEALRQGGPT